MSQDTAPAMEYLTTKLTGHDPDRYKLSSAPDGQIVVTVGNLDIDQEQRTTIIKGRARQYTKDPEGLRAEIGPGLASDAYTSDKPIQQLTPQSKGAVNRALNAVNDIVDNGQLPLSQGVPPMKAGVVKLDVADAEHEPGKVVATITVNGNYLLDREGIAALEIEKTAREEAGRAPMLDGKVMRGIIRDALQKDGEAQPRVTDAVDRHGRQSFVITTSNGDTTESIGRKIKDRLFPGAQSYADFAVTTRPLGEKNFEVKLNAVPEGIEPVRASGSRAVL